MAKSLQVTVTNPDDLNTLQGELVTQNYNLEILGLKNPADFRKFSKSLMMLDRILKETNDKVDNGLKEKLNKGSYNGDAGDLKREIDGKEPAFSKNSGFNKEKTDEYKVGTDTDKVFTQKGANDLYKEVEKDIRNIDLSGKTDKGRYEGSAQDLKDEIDKKVNKSGDTMTGTLNIDNNDGALFNVITKNTQGGFGSINGNSIYMINRISNKSIELFNDGGGKYPAGNLVVGDKKELVEAINYLYKKDGYGSYRIDGQGSLDSIEPYSGTFFYYDTNLVPYTGSAYGYALNLKYTAGKKGGAQIVIGDINALSNKIKILARVGVTNLTKKTDWVELYHSGNLNPNDILINSEEVMDSSGNAQKKAYTLTQPLSDKYNFINVQFSQSDKTSIRVVRYPMKFIKYGETSFMGNGVGGATEFGLLIINSKTQVTYMKDFVEGNNQCHVTKIWQSYV